MQESAGEDMFAMDMDDEAEDILEEIDHMKNHRFRFLKSGQALDRDNQFNAFYNDFLPNLEKIDSVFIKRYGSVKEWALSLNKSEEKGKQPFNHSLYLLQLVMLWLEYAFAYGSCLKYEKANETSPKVMKILNTCVPFDRAFHLYHERPPGTDDHFGQPWLSKGHLVHLQNHPVLKEVVEGVPCASMDLRYSLFSAETLAPFTSTIFRPEFPVHMYEQYKDSPDIVAAMKSFSAAPIRFDYLD
jgi:hypothetical protein